MKPITKADVRPVADMLAAAFHDEPGLAWLVSDPAARQAMLPRFFKAIVDGTRREGLAFCNEDHTAAVLWRLPGRTTPGLMTILRGFPAMMPFVRAAGPRARQMSAAVRAHAPAGGARYLQFLGVAPSCQGKGLGGQMVRHGLALGREAGQSAYLETAKPANVEFYRGLGFQETRRWQVGTDGPVFTSMVWPG